MQVKEPRVRKDGRCRVCRGERKFGRQSGINPLIYERDPFCSAECSRAFYGTQISTEKLVRK